MLSLLLFPDILMVIVGLGIFAPQKHLRLVSIIAAPIAAIISVWMFPVDYYVSLPWLSQISLEFRLDIVSRFMITIFAIVALAGGIYAHKFASAAEIYISYAYVAAGMLCMVAADFLSLIIAWELLAILGVLLLWFSRERRASAAAMRYALWHFLGGAIFLAGIGFHLWESGMNASLQALSLSTIGGKLIFIGILINTGLVPFTSWVVDAYSKASISGAVFLSSITTKTAIIIMARLFAGETFLMYPAIVTIIIACIYALREDDIRKLLAWAILIQVGFMVAAISVDSALNMAVTAQAGVHILYKSTLFMAAGLVIHYTGSHRFSALGGLHQQMPVVYGLAVIAALTSMAMPLTAGFLAKAALLNIMADHHGYIQWSMLVILSAAAALPTGLWFLRWIFSGEETHHSSSTIAYMPKAAMAITASMCLLLAVPNIWNLLLPSLKMGYYYNFKEVIHALQLILAVFGGGYLLMGFFKPKNLNTVGLDWLWREGYVKASESFNQYFPIIFGKYQQLQQKIITKIYSAYDKISSPNSVLNRPQAVSRQALNIVAFLGFFSFIWLLFA